MRLDRILNWIIVAIAALVVILLFDLMLGLVVGLARAAVPILISFSWLVSFYGSLAPGVLHKGYGTFAVA